MSNDKRKKEFREKLLERQSEAKIVRKIVMIVILVISLILVGAIGGGYFYIKSAMKPVNPSDENVIKVEIPIGSSVTSIANILEENGVIKNARIFKYYIKFKNETGFMAGKYNLAPSMTIEQIIESLKTGKVMQEVKFKITIPEGKQLKQIAALIAEKTNQNNEDVFNTLNSKTFIDKMMKKYPNILTDEILNKQILYPLEGYLFPATYSFHTEKPTLDEIVSVMLEKTSEVVKEFDPQIQEKEYSVHKLLTMASLIEEEATAKVDREMIASVFYNRIEVDMPLQTDPTVLYAQGKHKERVLYKDLEIESPYNTYKVTGLPPGPIANAGVMSIKAVLSPADTDFYYFLATSGGEVIFTKTLDEHNNEKAKHITGKNN